MQSFWFTSCAAVLFDSAPRLEDVARALQGWNVSGHPNEVAGEHGWAVSGPGFIIRLRSGAVGIVDLVDRPWPDDPGAAGTTPALGSAWRLGAFGPGSAPGALARAADQPWTWADGAAAAERHRAFVRLRTGVGAAGDAEEQPPAERAPWYELMMLTELAQGFLRLPGALAFFVPAGEALRSREQMDAALERKIGVGPPPLELWTNVRSVSLVEEGDVRWLGLDTVGMTQLGLPDQEAVFAEGQEEPPAVEALLRNVCLHLLTEGPIPPGSTADDGRGRRWRAAAGRGIVAPPRPVLRWLPEESARPSEATLAKLSSMAGTG